MQRGHRRPGSTAALRLSNERAILQDLLTHGPSTQSELARRTRLSNGSVSSIVRSLRGRGVLETSDTVSSGRRATLVTPRVATRRVAVGIDLGRSHIGLVIAKPGRELLAERRVRIPHGTLAEEALGQVRALLTEELRQIDRGDEDIVAVVVSVPGPIDRTTGRVVDGTILPEWVGRSAEDVSEALGLDAEICNDADAGAIAERGWGAASGVDDFLYVKIGTGIGVGVFLAGANYTGAFGIAGEIGHSTVDPGGGHCRCGNRGCLETVASVPVVLQHLSDALGRDVTREELNELAASEHRATVRVIQAAGLALGQSIAMAANTLGPRLVVLGGPLSETGDVLLEAVRGGFSRFAIAPVVEATRVELSTLGEGASARGAATMAFEHGDALAYMAGADEGGLLSGVDIKNR
ncbi:ROK family transcriptional regulator [Sediminivirga luteola]|uniref:Transcriptional regulator n=1 Tax=Sediminivirga luteola TaxID=1774748 RepID=A0A8J2U0Q7_9MICO|nr:ROK family transcriptional regulator [Sediminivirga luteola]GGA26527.1 transcriptional regulator [Sediminivirga luteola]